MESEMTNSLQGFLTNTVKYARNLYSNSILMWHTAQNRQIFEYEFKALGLLPTLRRCADRGETGGAQATSSLPQQVAQNTQDP